MLCIKFLSYAFNVAKVTKICAFAMKFAGWLDNMLIY